MRIKPYDREILRNLAHKIVFIANRPEMEKRRMRWVRHNNMETSGILINMDPQGSWCELIPEKNLECLDQNMRNIENSLRRRIYAAEHFVSDNVVEKEWVVNKTFSTTGWGVAPLLKHSDSSRGAYAFEPVIKEYNDLKKLRYPEIVYDEKSTAEQIAFFQDLFGDILDIRVKGVADFSYHLMKQYTTLRGLEETLIDFSDNPHMVHDAMAFFEEGHHRILKQYIDLNF